MTDEVNIKSRTHSPAVSTIYYSRPIVSLRLENGNLMSENMQAQQFVQRI